MEDFREVKLPEHLCKAAETRWGHRFSSIEEQLTFLLSEISREESDHMDQREKHMIDERLKNLGYM
jgi:DNA-binding transcriptional regulator WhiA